MNVPFRVSSTQGLTNENLPTAATYVLVDNTSNQWLYQPDAQRYIAPYAMNVSMPLAGVGGANMQVAAPPGVTQPAPIAGQQYLATFSDAAPGGYPYTSQMNVDITDGQVNATITGGTMDATVNGSVDANITNASLAVTGTVTADISGGTVNANITNSNVNATIQNASLDVNSTLVHTLINGVVIGDSAFANATWVDIGWGGSPISGWSLTQINSASPVTVELSTTPGGGGAHTLFWIGRLPQNEPVSFQMPAGLAIRGDTMIGVLVIGPASTEVFYNFYPAV